MTFRRVRLIVFGLFAVVGTIAAVLIAIGVAPTAKTSLEVALLGFACAAAVSGFLGLIVSWLSYRLDAGRVPKPDLAILDDGKTTRRLEIAIELLDSKDDSELAAQLARETEAMEASIAKVEQPRAKRTSNLITNFDVAGHISDDDMAKYRAEVTDYLETYEARLRDKRAFDAVMARSREVIFAFTNDRAGVPGDGVRAVIRVPDGVRVLERSDVPEDPGMPGRPKPPRAHSILSSFAVMTRGLDAAAFRPTFRPVPIVGRPRNVSAPTIRSGSFTEILFTVGEILHNLQADSHEDPVVFVFARAATWVIPYEVHARNLPSAKRGELTITTALKAPAVSRRP
jgi:hypothetical protein